MSSSQKGFDDRSDLTGHEATAAADRNRLLETDCKWLCQRSLMLRYTQRKQAAAAQQPQIGRDQKFLVQRKVVTCIPKPGMWELGRADIIIIINCA